MIRKLSNLAMASVIAATTLMSIPASAMTDEERERRERERYERMNGGDNGQPPRYEDGRDNGRDHGRDYDRDRHNDYERERERERQRDRERQREYERERERERQREWERERERERQRERERDRYYPPTNPPYYPPTRPPVVYPPTTSFESLYLGRWVNHETIQLSYLMNLIQKHYGTRVESVDVITSGSTAHGVELALLINGNVQDREYSPAGTVRLNPYSQTTLGSEVRDLSVRVSGQVYITEIRVNLGSRSGGGGGYYPPRDQVLERQIGQSYYGIAQLDLGSLFDLRSFQGSRVAQIEVEMSALNYSANAELLVNGYSSGISQRVSTSTQVYYMYINGENRIGYGGNSLHLRVNGDVYIRSVKIRLTP